MDILYGIQLAIGEIKVFTGYGLHRYAFNSSEDAQEYIDDHWTQFDARWRKRNLSVATLPPPITVPGLYLKFERSK